MTNKITNRKAFTLGEVKPSRRGAFTLAEVLITIGIIGVVAVLVIVPFMQDIQNKDLATSANVFEKRLEQALKVMNTQGTLSGYDTTEEFVEALSKNFKIAKICDNEHLNQCFKSKFYDAEKNDVVLNDLIFSRQLAQQDWGTQTVGVRFVNGVSAILVYNPRCEENPTDNMIPVLNCIAMVYDVNGNGKPNQLSKDVHTINTSTGLGVIATVNGVKITGIAKAGTYPVVDCANTDNKYCYGSKSYDNDYWSGAAQYCGGKEKMASEDELLKIAKYLYNDDTIDGSVTAPNTVATTVDKDNLTKLNSYGFPNPKFSVWSSNVSSSTAAYTRSFRSTSTARYNNYRNLSSFLAVCTKQ